MVCGVCSREYFCDLLGAATIDWAPPPKNVEQGIYGYVDFQNNDAFLTTNLLEFLKKVDMKNTKQPHERSFSR